MNKSNKKTVSYELKQPIRQFITLDKQQIGLTIRWNNNRKLMIIGNIGKQDQYKVIQLDEDQAIQFIRQQCDRDIRNIVNRLRYNSTQRVMYLVGTQILDDYEFQDDEQENQQNK